MTGNYLVITPLQKEVITSWADMLYYPLPGILQKILAHQQQQIAYETIRLFNGIILMSVAGDKLADCFYQKRKYRV